MPKVPVSNRRVQEKVFQSRGVSAKAPIVGGDTGLAAGASKLVEQAHDIYAKEKKKVKDTTRREVVTDLRRKMDTDLYDKDSGFTTLNGKQTQESYTDAQERYNKFVEERIAQVGDATLRDEFKETIGQEYMGRFTKSIDIHTGNEMEAHDNQVFKDSISSIKNEAVNGYQSGLGDGSAASVNEMQTEIQAYGEARGMDKVTIDNMKLDAASDLHKGVIMAALAEGNDLSAKDYYKEAKKNKQINAKDKVKLDNMMKQSSILGDSQRIVGEVLEKGLGRKESLEILEQKTKGKKPELIDEARRRLNNRMDEKKRVERENQEELKETYFTSLRETGTLDDIRKTEGWAALPQKSKVALEKYEKRLINGDTQISDKRILHSFRLGLANPKTRKKFMDKSLIDIVDKLSDQHFDELSKIKASYVKGGRDEDNIFGNFVSNTTQINTNAKKHGITNDKDKAALHDYISEKAIQWQRRKKVKTIPDDELQKIIDKALTPVELDDWFGDDTRLFKVKPGQQIEDLTYEDIPESEIKDMEAIYAKKNITPSRSRMVRDYQDYINKELAGE